MITKMLELSTSHITEETSQWVHFQSVEITGRFINGPLVIYNKDDYGWFIYIPEQLTEEEKNVIPSELVAIVEMAQKEGCGWVMLDCDIEPTEELPIYDW